MGGRRALVLEPDPNAAGGRWAELLFGVPHRFFFMAGVVQDERAVPTGDVATGAPP